MISYHDFHDMTAWYDFMQSYYDGITYKELINNMRKWLKNNRYTQVPQLSSGKELNLDEKYLLSFFN